MKKSRRKEKEGKGGAKVVILFSTCYILVYGLCIFVVRSEQCVANRLRVVNTRDSAATMARVSCYESALCTNTAIGLIMPFPGAIISLSADTDTLFGFILLRSSTQKQGKSRRRRRRKPHYFGKNHRGLDLSHKRGR